MKRKTKPHQAEAEYENLQGRRLRTRYRKAGFAVVSFLVIDTGKEATVIGDFPESDFDEVMNLTGRWVDDDTYGRQFRVDMASRVMPKNPEGIARYLAGEIPGIGPKRAKQLAEKFGAGLRDVLDKTPLWLMKEPASTE